MVKHSFIAMKLCFFVDIARFARKEAERALYASFN